MRLADAMLKVQNIEVRYSGLPLIRTSELLRRAGIDPLRATGA